jgi:hypothetical protein
MAANRKITDLTALDVSADGDQIVIVDISETDEEIRTKRQTKANFLQEVTNALGDKANANHDHDDIYYTQVEMDNGQMDSRYTTTDDLNSGYLDDRYVLGNTVAQPNGIASLNEDGKIPADQLPEGGGSPAGNTNEIQLNNDGAFGASSDFTFDSGELFIQNHSGSSARIKLQSEQYSETDRFSTIESDIISNLILKPNYVSGKVKIETAGLEISSPKHYLHDLIYGYNNGGGWAGRLLHLENTANGKFFTVTNAGQVFANTSSGNASLNLALPSYDRPAISLFGDTGDASNYLTIKAGSGTGEGSSLHFIRAVDDLDNPRFEFRKDGTAVFHPELYSKKGFIIQNRQAEFNNPFIEFQDQAGTELFQLFSNANGGVTFNAIGSGARFTFADRVNMPTHTPASASGLGTAGDIAWDSSYIYVCTATDTWKRASVVSW